jgi:hypothetical protein
MSGSFVHKIIIAGCRSFAGPIPSGPHRSGNMKKMGPRNAKTERRVDLRRVALLALVVSPLAAAVIYFFVASRDDGQSFPATTPPRTTQATAVATTVDTRAEIVDRLHQILEIRDQAIETRNASLLQQIYTVDCPCLKGDSSLISRLRGDRLVWRGIDISLQIEKVERINDRLWTVNAVVIAAPYTIERESGEVIQRIPQGRELSRFALAKPNGEDEWLLGQASLVE